MRKEEKELEEKNYNESFINKYEKEIEEAIKTNKNVLIKYYTETNNNNNEESSIDTINVYINKKR